MNSFLYAFQTNIRLRGSHAVHLALCLMQSVNGLQVLSPRSDIGMYHCGKNKKKKLRDGEKDKETSGGEGKLEEQRDPSTIVSVHLGLTLPLGCTNQSRHYG